MPKFFKVILVIAGIIGLVVFGERLTRPNIARLEQTQNVAKLFRAVNHHNYNIRKDANEALVRIGDPVVNVLIPMLEHEEADIRADAAKILGEIGDPRSVDPLIAMLGDTDEGAREAAADALGQIGDIRAVDPLISLLGDADEDVREAAANALGQIGDPRAIEQLVENGAISTLSDFGEAAIPALIEALQIPYSIVGDDAKHALVRIGIPAVEPIISLLKHEDDSIASDAIWVLEQINDPATEDVLIGVLGDNAVAYTAGRMIVGFHDGNIRVLLPYLKQASTVGVYRALISYGDPDTISPLIHALEMFGDKDMAVYYLNCGNDELESAAQTWANDNGYTVLNYDTQFSGGSQWGGGQ